MPPPLHPLSARGWLWNGLVFSLSFALLEGCVAATVVLSHALLQTRVASTATAALYLSFSLFTLISPYAVCALGVRRALVGATGAYALYTAAYLSHEPAVLYVGAVVGGGAGAVLWTAQGVYYTRNARAYAEAATGSGQPTEGTIDAVSHAQARPVGLPLRHSLDLFAGLFTFFFNLSLALGKPLAGLCLTIWPDNPAILFGTYTAISIVCTFSMACVRPLDDKTEQTLPAESDARPFMRDGSVLAADSVVVPDLSAPSELEMSPVASEYHVSEPVDCPAAVDETGSLSEVGTLGDASPLPAASVRVSVSHFVACEHPGARAVPSEGRRCCKAWVTSSPVGSACSLLFDGRMMLLLPTNAAFGCMTALFPAVVAPMVGDAFGTAAVGWFFAVAGATSVVVTVGITALAAYARAGRLLALYAGAITFGFAGARLVACGEGCVQLTRLEWGVVFIAYGIGVAVWQACVMALVGEMHHVEPHAAFAHLKLTSALSSFGGFALLPKLRTRDAAGVCLCVVVIGAVCLAVLTQTTTSGCVGLQATSLSRDGARLVHGVRPTASGTQLRAIAACDLNREEDRRAGGATVTS